MPTKTTPTPQTKVMASAPSVSVLAYAVTRPDRADLRSALVVVTAAAPWLAAFPLAVRGGTETLGALAITFVWGVGVVFVGIVLFYVVLWVVTRVTGRPAPTPG